MSWLLRISLVVGILLAGLGCIAIAMLPPLPAPRLAADDRWRPPAPSIAPEDAWLQPTIDHLRAVDGLERLAGRVRDGISDRQLREGLPALPLRLPDGWERRISWRDRDWADATLVLGGLRIGDATPLLMAACVEVAHRRTTGFASYSTWDAIPDALLRTAGEAGPEVTDFALTWLDAPQPERRTAAALTLGSIASRDCRAALNNRLRIEADPSVARELAWAGAMQGDTDGMGKALARTDRYWPSPVQLSALLEKTAGRDRQAGIDLALAVLAKRQDDWRGDVRIACLGTLERLHASERAPELLALMGPRDDARIAHVLRRWRDPAGTAALEARCRAGDIPALVGLIPGGRDDVAAAWVMPLLGARDPVVRYQAMHTLLAIAPQQRDLILTQAGAWTERGLADEVRLVREIRR